jgi:hypothetical protein
LHGYQPLVVDEHCLTAAGRREAIIDVVFHPRDWRRHVTQQEVETLERKLAEIQKQAAIQRRKTPNVYYAGEPPEMEKKRREVIHRGSFRAYARQKYGAGGRIWFGDGPPPWER